MIMLINKNSDDYDKKYENQIWFGWEVTSKR